jgi:hypothetical protein
VRLRIYSAAAGGRIFEVTTDSNGRYVAPGLGEGGLSITPVSTSGFIAPCPAGGFYPGYASFDVDLVSTELLSSSGTPASLRKSSIYTSGTVYEETATGTRPVARASVGLGFPENDFSYSMTLTDTLGRYLVCTSPPGVGTDQYMPLTVSKEGYTSSSRQVFGGWDYSGVNVRLIRK